MNHQSPVRGPGRPLMLERVPADCPAGRVVLAFGGARALARALEGYPGARTPATIYRWLPTHGGAGAVPARAIPAVLAAAARLGIALPPETWAPGGAGAYTVWRGASSEELAELLA